MVKQFYLTHRFDPSWYYHSGSEGNQGVMKMKGYSTFPKAPGLEPRQLDGVG